MVFSICTSRYIHYSFSPYISSLYLRTSSLASSSAITTARAGGAEIVFAAEEDLPSVVILLAPDDALGPVAGIAGVIPAVI